MMLRGLLEEEVERSVAELREELSCEHTSTTPEPIPRNQSVDLLQRVETETEQSRFFKFLAERVEQGMIPFREDGKPNRKAMDDAVMLFFRPEEAQQKGISLSPTKDAIREPLNDMQTTYLDQLRQRIIVASGHTAHKLPYESSMHKIVRELNKLQPAIPQVQHPFPSPSRP